MRVTKVNTQIQGDGVFLPEGFSFPHGQSWLRTNHFELDTHIPVIVELDGHQALVHQACQAIAKLQIEKTMTSAQIAAIKNNDPKVKKSGMGGAETFDEILENSHRPGWRVLAVYLDRQLVGFHDFMLDPIPMEIFKLYRHYQSHLPENLKKLSRDQIGFGGTVVMNIPGQYKNTHARMIDCQKYHGKKLILDFCFTLNENALAAHTKLGYKVLCDENNQPIRVKWHYNTNDKAGNDLFILYLDVETEFQNQLIENAKIRSSKGEIGIIDLTNND